MSRLIVVVVSVVLCIVVGMLWLVYSPKQPDEVLTLSVQQPTRQTNTALVLFGTTEVRAEVVDTPEKRQQGLSGRRTLAEGEGMLFVFEESDYYPFWMPDMYISIDILWLDEAGRVVYLKENATPESYPEHFSPDTPARYVLEVPSGYARAHGIQVGSQATIELPTT